MQGFQLDCAFDNLLGLNISISDGGRILVLKSLIDCAQSIKKYKNRNVQAVVFVGDLFFKDFCYMLT